MLRKSAAAWLAAIMLTTLAAATAAAPPFGFQAVPRDAFPVFDDPRMLSAREAEEKQFIFDRDVIIGVAHNGEAKAYPITIMGVHELGNDSIGGVPIAVSW